MLTQAEREKFADYLEREALSDAAMVKRMEEMKVPEEMIKRLRIETMAARVICLKLRSISTDTIG